MSVFVVAVLMAGLGYYWGLQSRAAAGTVAPKDIWRMAASALAYALLSLIPFAMIVMGDCLAPSQAAMTACLADKRAEVSVFLICASALLAFTVAAWAGGRRRAWWWPLALWPLPFLLAIALT